ncbi:MAG: LuxR C-terminal-related transcriptional regulator [Saprospiraceae bacterium]|nr:LuxR C-terminal-related transcriptional regulator [Saprospiraceae bacterium]
MKAPSSIPSVLEKLTQQEERILKLVANGLAYTEIATQLNISPLTVKTHRQNIALKAEVKGTSAIRKFVREAASHLKILLLYALSSIVGVF